MLKIKDSVDLKELEKFGFREKGNVGYESNIYWILKEDKIIRLQLNSKTKEYLWRNNAIEDVIYDLFQADMVEKVEE